MPLFLSQSVPRPRVQIVAPICLSRLSGLVLDAQNNQPIKRRQVAAACSDQNVDVVRPQRLLIRSRSSPVRTGQDGTFVLESVRNLALLSQGGLVYDGRLVRARRLRALLANARQAWRTATGKSGGPLIPNNSIIIKEIIRRTPTS